MGNGTKRENAFIYADKEQQLIRANRFMTLASTSYYLYVMALLVISVILQIRSLGFAGYIAFMVVVALGLTWFIFKRNNKSKRLRYVVIGGLCAISWIISFAFSQDFAMMIGSFIIIGGVLYFDKKYSRLCAHGIAIPSILIFVFYY